MNQRRALSLIPKSLMSGADCRIVLLRPTREMQALELLFFNISLRKCLKRVTCSVASWSDNENKTYSKTIFANHLRTLAG